jgi:hypothetical protein
MKRRFVDIDMMDGGLRIWHAGRGGTEEDEDEGDEPHCGDEGDEHSPVG